MCICTDARTLLQTELQVLTDIPEVKTQLWMVANIRGGVQLDKWLFIFIISLP
jgi:hypothetical protein